MLRMRRERSMARARFKTGKGEKEMRLERSDRQNLPRLNFILNRMKTNAGSDICT